MAQPREELWHTLWTTPGTRQEFRFFINGNEYGKGDEVSHSVDYGLYEDFGIGNARSASFHIRLYAENIPRAAKIQRQIRLVNSERKTQWYPHGTYFTNTRSVDDGLWDVEAFDAMRKGDVIWIPDKSLSFPMTMVDVVNEFCRLMDVELDERTVLNPNYTMDYPYEDYTIREILGFIGAANGGNWIITPAGKLHLVTLISFPDETSYLVDPYGDTLLFGGTRILIGGKSPIRSASENVGDKFFVGLNITGFGNRRTYKEISRVTLIIKGDSFVTAGDDTGFELSAECPYATQEMADSLLNRLIGYKYQAYSSEAASIDPSVELGDGITVNGIYSVVARLNDSGDGYPSLSAPGENELDEEYPYVSQNGMKLKRLEDSVKDIKEDIGGIEDDLDDVQNQINNIEEKINEGGGGGRCEHPRTNRIDFTDWENGRFEEELNTGETVVFSVDFGADGIPQKFINQSDGFECTIIF